MGWLYDIVRGTLICDAPVAIEQVVKRLIDDPRVLAVLKGKNRFKKPTPSGFRDILVQLQMRFELEDGRTVVHICEVQIHLKAVKQFDTEHDSHTIYEYFRRYFAGSMDTVAKRMEDLQAIVGVDYQGGGVAEVVQNVVQSVDMDRLSALSTLMTDYLCEQDLALYLLKAAAKLRITAVGERHSSVGQTYNNMADVLATQGKLDEAMAMYQKALEIKVETLGERHSSVGDTCYNMALGKEKLGDLEQAAELFERCVTCYSNAYGEHHEETVDAQDQLVRIRKLITTP